jgi:uncharacterized membrane protein
MPSFSAKASIASNALALVALGAAWHGHPATAPLSYSLHKWLHVAGIVVFLGNLVAGPLWVAFAWWQEERAHLRFAVRTLVAADVWLTAPGLQLTVWNGVCLAAVLGGARQQPWLAESLAWLVATSVFSMALVLPWQERLLAAVEAADEAATRRALVWWSVLGSASALPLGVVSWLMVAKTPLVLGP